MKLLPTERAEGARGGGLLNWLESVFLLILAPILDHQRGVLLGALRKKEGERSLA